MDTALPDWPTAPVSGVASKLKALTALLLSPVFMPVCGGDPDDAIAAAAEAIETHRPRTPAEYPVILRISVLTVTRFFGGDRAAVNQKASVMRTLSLPVTFKCYFWEGIATP